MKKQVVKDISITASVLICSFLLSILFQNIFEIDEHITTLFAFAVFLISLWTNGYVYGITSAFISTLAINYAFTFPYFAFNFTIPVNLISAIVMIIIALLTGALTTKIKHQEAIKAESEKERMRANLLRAVSHDIRTPLTTIYGSTAELIENKKLTEFQKSKMLEGIKQDAVWLIRMVENLLSVTKLENGRVKLNKTPTVVDELVDSVLVKFKKRFPEVNLVVSMPEEIVVVPMDALLISQVLVNLLENSVIHAEGYTKIQLRVKKENSKAVFEIEDDGCGISKEKLQNIFDGYFESKEVVADSKKKDAGIGLSVCAAIIKAHDGEICAENMSKGVIFRFILNAEEDEDISEQ